MSNVLSVAVANTTTIWAPTQMPAFGRELVREAQDEYRFYLDQHAHFEWARVLIAEYEADPVRRRLKVLQWHLRNHRTRMVMR